jgi:hypothetical protein
MELPFNVLWYHQSFPGYVKNRFLVICNDHFQGVLLHRIAKRVICLQDIVQSEVVRDQLYWLDLA